MACECIDIMNRRLAEKNSRLVTSLCWPYEIAEDGSKSLGTSYQTASLTCEKIEPRKRDKLSAIATFCPFCGMRYVEEQRP